MSDLHLKAALCSFGEEIQTQDLNIYDMNETIIHQDFFSITE